MHNTVETFYFCFVKWFHWYNDSLLRSRDPCSLQVETKIPRCWGVSSASWDDANIELRRLGWKKFRRFRSEANLKSPLEIDKLLLDPRLIAASFVAPKLLPPPLLPPSPGFLLLFLRRCLSSSFSSSSRASSISN